MRNIFRSVVLCAVFCGALHTEPSQDIESLSPLAQSYFAIETKTIGEYKLFLAKPKTTHAKPYPILVVLDGNAHFPFVINQYIMHQYTPTQEPLFIVGIGYDGDLAYDVPRRTRDYTPIVRDTKGGGAKAFYEVLQTQIMPLIQQAYCTESSSTLDSIVESPCAKPTDIAFFGHSFGGLFGLYVFLHHQEMFTYYMIASPSLWWGGINIDALDTCESKIVFTKGTQEPHKGGILFSDFVKALYAKCPNTHIYAQYFHGGHGDTIKASIPLVLSDLLTKSDDTQ